MNRSRDFLVGLVFFGLLFVLGLFTIFLGDFRFGPVTGMDVAFERVDGLEAGAGVRVNGVRSGVVDAVTPDPDLGKIIVTVKFDGEPKIYEGAKFEIKALSVLGGTVLAVTNGKKADGELDLSKMQNGEEQTDLFSAVGEVATQLKEILAKNDANLERAIAAFADTGEEAKKILRDNGDNLKRAVDGIAAFAEELGVRGPGILADVETVADRLEKGEGTIGMLLKDDGLARNLSAAAERIYAVADRLEKGEGTVGRLLTDDSLARNLEAAAADIRTFMAEVKSGQGTLGMLIRDRRLYDEATQTVASLKAAAERIDHALGRDADNNVVGLLLTDPKMAEELKRSVKALSDFLESQRENAPLTTFAGLLFKPF